MPNFPVTFPYYFGNGISADSDTLALVASTSAAVTVNRNAETALVLSAVPTSGGRYDAAGNSTLAAIASPSGATTRTTYGDVNSSLSINITPDSSETGFASTSSSVLATPSSDAARTKSLDSSTQFLFTGSGDTYREALIWCSTTGTFTSTGYYGAPGVSVPAKAETFIDAFISKDLTRWSGWGNGIDVIGGRLSVDLSQNGAIYTTGTIQTGDGVLDLTGSEVTAQLVQPPNVDNGTSYTRLSVVALYSTTDQSNLSSVMAEWVGGNWRFSQADASGAVSSSTSVSYSTGSWVRIRLVGGTVYWDTSPDGLNWTNEKSQAVVGSGLHGASISISGYAGSGSDPGVALWDNINNTPLSIGASLSVSAISTAVGSRGQYIDSDLGASADDLSGTQRYDANAQAALSIDPHLIAAVMRTQQLTSTLSLIAESSGDSTEYGTADASLGVLFETSQDTSANYASESNLTMYTSLFSAVIRGQSVDSETSITAYFISIGFANYIANGTLQSYAFPTAHLLRNAISSASLSAQISCDADAFEYVIADTSFAIAHSSSSSATRVRYIESNTQIGTSNSGFAITNQKISASTSVTAVAWSTIEEPLVITRVTADNRKSTVSASPRKASVNSDGRTAVVNATETRGSTAALV